MNVGFPFRMLACAALAAAILAGCATTQSTCPPPPPPAPHTAYHPSSWSELPGWNGDEMMDAWPAFLESCKAAGRRPRWESVCDIARDTDPATSADVRAFFQRYFEPFAIVKQVGSQADPVGLITGYFEPLLYGSRTRSARFNTPLYAPPPDLLTVDLAAEYPMLRGMRIRARLVGHRVVPYYSRADLDHDPALKNDAIVWVNDSLSAFFLEVQGSGRVQLPTGETIRLHYADENGYPYRSIGRYLVDHGDLERGTATVPAIRGWALAHPDQVPQLLDADPSVVFFREEPLGNPALGPMGSLGVPLTPSRSVAIDPAAIPLGAPVFLATTYPDSQTALDQLVFAQDTGGAIRGSVRADYFWGIGAQAAAQAGDMRQRGRMWLIWPKGEPLPGG